MTVEPGVVDPPLGALDSPSNRLVRLQRITRVLSGLIAPADVAREILHEIAPQLGGVAGAMWLADSDTGELTLLHARSPELAAMPLETTSMASELPSAVVARTGEALYIRTLDERDRRFPALVGTGSVACFVTLPLFGADDVAGVLAIGFRDPHTFDEEECLFLEAVADQAAVAIERWRLHGSEHRAVSRLALLANVSGVLASSLDYAETLRAVARMAVPDLADLATVHLFDEGRLRRVALAQRDSSFERVLIDMTTVQAERASNKVIDEALERHRAIVINAAGPSIAAEAEADSRLLTLVEAVSVSAVIAAPLVARGVTSGVLTLMRVDGDEAYTAEDVSLAEELARRAAVAIDNAHLHERHREIADLLQKSLLPPSIEAMPHAEMAAAYHPSGGIEVGGDFYDQVRLDDGRWIVTVGDICGTGPSAAAATALVRHTARAGAHFGADPCAVVTAVNEALLRTLDSDRFCTMIYVEACPGQDGLDLTVVNCGHPVPLIVRAAGQVEDAPAKGTLLGVVPGASWTPVHITLEAGDSLVLYTDGVTEARAVNATEGELRPFFGEGRLATALQRAAGAPAAALVSAIEESLEAFAGSPLEDDVAIVALTASSQR
ncbi:MAG: hypothetical protein NVS3B21_16250 [Acidimicrobiales bacterium]